MPRPTANSGSGADGAEAKAGLWLGCLPVNVATLVPLMPTRLCLDPRHGPPGKRHSVAETAASEMAQASLAVAMAPRNQRQPRSARSLRPARSRRPASRMARLSRRPATAAGTARPPVPPARRNPSAIATAAPTIARMAGDSQSKAVAAPGQHQHGDHGGAHQQQAAEPVDLAPPVIDRDLGHFGRTAPTRQPPSGTLIQKIIDQFRCSAKKPPSTGPLRPASIQTPLKYGLVLAAFARAHHVGNHGLHHRHDAAAAQPLQGAAESGRHVRRQRAHHRTGDEQAQGQR